MKKQKEWHHVGVPTAYLRVVKKKSGYNVFQQNWVDSFGNEAWEELKVFDESEIIKKTSKL